MAINGGGINIGDSFGSGISAGKMVGFVPSDLEMNYSRLGEYACSVLYELCQGSIIIINRISNSWASPEAVTYCDSLSKEFNMFLTKSCNTLLDIVRTIKNAADKWQTTTGYKLNLPSKEAQLESNLSFTESHARESVNGIVGVDLELVCKYDPNIRGNYYSKMQELIRCADSLGFIGANQMDSLKRSLGEISNEFNNKLKKIDEETYAYCKKIAEKYRDTGNEINNEFQKIQTILDGVVDGRGISGAIV